MAKSVLHQFATDLLASKLDFKGFVRKKNVWYRIIPDVILCVEVFNARSLGFDVRFGVVPFVCFHSFRFGLSCFQSEFAYQRAYPNEVKKIYAELYGIPNGVSDRFNYSIDSTASALREPNKKALLIKYWGDIFDKTIAPYLFKVQDLSSAAEAINDFLIVTNISSAEPQYPLGMFPLFMKLRNTQDVLPQWDRLRERLRLDFDDVDAVFEQRAEYAVAKGDFSSPYLVYKLIKNKDLEGMLKAVEACEAEAYVWLEKEGLSISS